MSVVTTLSVVLFVGLIATGLVGISWMASPDARRRSCQRTSTTDALKINTLTRWRKMKQYRPRRSTL